MDQSTRKLTTLTPRDDKVRQYITRKEEGGEHASNEYSIEASIRWFEKRAKED